MAKTHKAVVDMARGKLNDASSVRWSDSDLLGYLNALIQEAVDLAPDAFVVNTDLTLVAGARQTLPGDGLALGAVNNNTASGAGIVEADKTILDALAPSWRGVPATTDAQFWLRDKTDRKAFYVYPPQPGTPGQVNLSYVKHPADGTINGVDSETVTTNLPIDDTYFDGLVDGVIGAAYERQTEAGSSDLSLKYRALYRAAFGGKS